MTEPRPWIQDLVFFVLQAQLHIDALETANQIKLAWFERRKYNLGKLERGCLGSTNNTKKVWMPPSAQITESKRARVPAGHSSEVQLIHPLGAVCFLFKDTLDLSKVPASFAGASPEIHCCSDRRLLPTSPFS